MSMQILTVAQWNAVKPQDSFDPAVAQDCFVCVWEGEAHLVDQSILAQLVHELPASSTRAPSTGLPDGSSSEDELAMESYASSSCCGGGCQG